MPKSLVAASILLALLAGFAAVYFARPGSAPSNMATIAVAHPNAQPVIAGSNIMSDDPAEWEKIPATSPKYAAAQRLLGYNYYARDKHDLVEAKKHVDLALAVAPNDRKVLEDAGRVYMLAGLTDQGAAMLKKADTATARAFLARH